MEITALRASISAHFIVEGGGVFAKRRLYFAPCVGDELRFSDNRYFKVTLLVWVYDEDETPGQRLNVGIAPA